MKLRLEPDLPPTRAVPIIADFAPRAIARVQYGSVEHAVTLRESVTRT